ncbi:hypothetical protein J7M00_02280 [bacterium]|nr:hypothetical protein [bacterium]
MHINGKIASLFILSTIFATAFAQRIDVYFSKSVDTVLCRELGVENLPDGWNVRLDSLLAAYIDSAQYSVDMCVYRWSDAMPFIIPAIRSALERGIKLRVIVDNRNTSYHIVDSLSELGVSYISGSYPMTSNKMHIKFFVIDGRDTDTTNDVAIISSSNITIDNILNDANNTVVAYWSALTQALTTQFEIYWGSSGDEPDIDESDFGDDFPDIIPHIITGDSITCELYFSPQRPQYEDSILNRISNCDYEVFFCINRFTRKYEYVDDTLQAIFYRGTNVKGVFGYRDNVYYDMLGANTDEDSIYNWNPTLEGYIFPDAISSGVIHSKYLIGDIHHQLSDPFVLTGSMNWSASGFDNNNECVFIIHSYEIAQKFFCEFATRYIEAGGSLAEISEIAHRRGKPITIFPNPTQKFIYTDRNLPIKIFDIRGRFLGQFFPPIDISNFPAGRYIIQPDSSQKTQSIILIK